MLAGAVVMVSFLIGSWYAQRSPHPTEIIAADNQAQAKDPVCGMDVEKAKAKTAGRTSQYQGNTYYFCSDHCKKEFDKNPAAFLKEKPAPKQQAVAQIDPVCGMEVDPASAKFKSRYEGKTYYFCNESCKKQFDANPKKYLKATN